jgi:Ca2+-binding EF-hand superfamily protein
MECLNEAIPREALKLSSEQIRLTQIFDTYDADKDGYLLLAEFERLCEESSLKGLPDSPSAY